MKIYEIIVGTMRGVASRLKGDGAGRHGRTRLLLLLHDSLVGGFYRDGETELGSALCGVSYELSLSKCFNVLSCGRSHQRR